ncbi:MAG: GNAT family N-acetyltransferase [Oscillospiraceae bacterium]|nr:GNAT family N-acetyltransferase [Oscillospiraceae bacterium]
MMIREIQPEDYAAVARFWRDYLDIAAATDESVSRTLEKMSTDSRYYTFVAEEDGRVVGFITYVEVLSIDDPDGYIKINGIAVHPEYRNRGIGTQLIARAEQTARERGSNSIGVASVFKRTETHRLYENLGFRKSAFWFHKNFD